MNEFAQPPTSPPPPPSGSPLRRWILLAGGIVVTLLVGLAIGLRVRPQSAVVQVVVTATLPADQQTVAQNQSAVPPPAASGNSPAPAADLMTFLLSDARHFQGDPNAPVTFIEFSDFK